MASPVCRKPWAGSLGLPMSSDDLLIVLSEESRPASAAKKAKIKKTILLSGQVHPHTFCKISFRLRAQIIFYNTSSTNVNPVDSEARGRNGPSSPSVIEGSVKPSEKPLNFIGHLLYINI